MSTVINETESDAALLLKVYVNNELIQLNPDQILRIQDIIDTPQQSQQIINYNMKSGFVYRFDVNFIFLHSLCQQKTAQKIKEILNHKVTITLLIIAMVLWTMISFMDHDPMIFKIVTWITYIPALFWLLLKHLLLNKSAFKLCIKSFDFWIKTCYGVMYVIALSLNYIKFFEFGGVPWLLSMVLSISYISSFDASNTSKTNKLIISASTALFMLFNAILYQFFPSLFGLEQEWYTIKMKSGLGMNRISTLSLLISSSRILAIFFVKQTYKTWNGKGIKAVVIEREPTIYWFDSVAQTKEANDANTVGADVENDNKQDIISVHQMTLHISKLSNAKKSPESTP